MLYALVARQLPFDEESFPALYARIKAGYFKIHQQFSDNLNMKTYCHALSGHRSPTLQCYNYFQTTRLKEQQKIKTT